MNDLEEFVASTDALIAQTATFIRESRERLVRDVQWLREKGIDLDALKAQADTRRALAESVESLFAARADPAPRESTRLRLFMHRKMLRRLV